VNLPAHMPQLEQLERADLIRVTQLEPELEYLFRHALVQDAAYASLLKQDRRRLHEAVARSLEALYADRLDDVAATLAYHLEAAGEVERAGAYYIRAGDSAAALYANAEAAVLYGKALDLMADSHAADQFDVLLKREKVYDFQGARTEQQADLERLTALAEQMGDPAPQAQVSLRRSSYLAAISDYHAAIEAAQQVVEWARQAQSAELEARGYLAQGIAEWRLSEFDAARRSLGQALNMARAADLADVEAHSLRHLGVVADYQENFAEAKSYLEQALPIFQRLGNHRAEGQALNSLGIVALNMGQLDEARNLLERALAIRRQQGDVYGVGITLANIAVVAQSQADFAVVDSCMRESLVICRTIGDREGEATALDGLGIVASHYGEYARAYELYQQALPITREIGDTLGELAVLINMSAAAWRLRQHTDAMAFGKQSLALAQELAVPQRERYALLRMADARQARDEGDAANALYEQAALLRQGEEHDNLSIAGLAGIARARLASGDMAAAAEHIATILEYLAKTTDLEDDVQRVYLTCCEVLRAADDPRYHEVLQTSHQRLLIEGDRIADEDRRRSYLDIPEHRAIMMAWAMLNPKA
jgi:tetratricopeptide (TPR) repeat protein